MAIDTITLPSPLDLHLHLRQPPLLPLTVSHLLESGFETALVMPNLRPALTTPQKAIDYVSQLEKEVSRLQSTSPNTKAQEKPRTIRFLATVYATPDLGGASEEELRKIVAVKWYPPHTTTNSDATQGEPETLLDERYEKLLTKMEKLGLVLCIHGESPRHPVLTAERDWMSTILPTLASKYPKLRMVVEHVSTTEGIEAVLSLPSTSPVAATITPHHLLLTTDDWAGQPLNFCKPVAKSKQDRKRLREVVASGNSRFFLGSDSAPHPHLSKLPSLFPSSSNSDSPATVPPSAAGIYTYPNLLPVLAEIFEMEIDGVRIPLEKMEGFCCHFGRDFYSLSPFSTSTTTTSTTLPSSTLRRPTPTTVTLRRHNVTKKTNDKPTKIPLAYSLREVETHNGKASTEDEDTWVIPFWAGKNLEWAIETAW